MCHCRRHADMHCSRSRHFILFLPPRSPPRQKRGKNDEESRPQKRTKRRPPPRTPPARQGIHSSCMLGIGGIQKQRPMSPWGQAPPLRPALASLRLSCSLLALALTPSIITHSSIVQSRRCLPARLVLLCLRPSPQTPWERGKRVKSQRRQRPSSIQPSAAFVHTRSASSLPSAYPSHNPFPSLPLHVSRRCRGGAAAAASLLLAAHGHGALGLLQILVEDLRRAEDKLVHCFGGCLVDDR